MLTGTRLKQIPSLTLVQNKIVLVKNVHEEREAPEQIMFGDGNWKFCVLLGLAIHLEQWVGAGEGLINTRIFALEHDNPKNAKSTVGKLLKALINSEDFHPVCSKPLGAHIVRKCANTYSRCTGNSKDDSDYWERWKGHRRQGDTYKDTILQFPDAKVAATLAIGGPV